MTHLEPPLDERKATVLRAIVSHYISSGEPAGSKTIAARSRLGVSAATIRNDMAALEEAGYVYHPHTSAGRIPTDAGYRYFVDTWGGNGKVTAQVARSIESFFGEPRWELEESLRQTAAFLSKVTDHAAVVFAPSLGPSTVRHVEVVALGSERAMLVLVTDTGLVENYVIAIPDELDEAELQLLAENLNRLVVGSPLARAGQTVEAALQHFPVELREIVGTVIKTLKLELGRREAERVFLEGTSTIVDEGKFADLETVRQVIGALEHRRVLLEVLADGVGAGSVSVRIGSENLLAEMQACSVVAAPYGVDDHPLGSLGIVGPTRMDYGRTIAAVHEVATNLGRMLAALT
jgi:heat-inducible transcriptional repressor